MFTRQQQEARLHRIWKLMHQRGEDKDWKTNRDFLHDMRHVQVPDWAHDIAPIDSSRPIGVKNFYFVTKRTLYVARGKKTTLNEWAKYLSIRPYVLQGALAKHGYNMERTLRTLEAREPMGRARSAQRMNGGAT